MYKKDVILFLFDLDGTLVTTGGAGVRSLSRTFQEKYGLKDVHKTISPAGKTDPAIFREIIRLHLKRDIDDQEMNELITDYLSKLSDEISSSNRVVPHPGAMELVRTLAKMENIMMGLGTGNIEKGARIKLEPTGLNPYFSFGGFGSDSENRTELLKMGHQKAEKIKNQKINSENVYIIGDTELDIKAARGAYFKCIAVATGGRTFEELEAHKPDFLMKDLREAFVFLKTLQGKVS